MSGLKCRSTEEGDFESMKVIGIDFTSRPTKSKPLTCLNCEFDGTVLKATKLLEWPSFEGFDAFLCSSGPWIAGIDFPFGQAHRFIETRGNQEAENTRRKTGDRKLDFRIQISDFEIKQLKHPKRCVYLRARLG